MLICVTNQELCKDDFLIRIERLARGNPHAIMLREKDISLKDYENLAGRVKEICEMYHVPLIINKNITSAKKYNLSNIHLSMSDLKLYKSELGNYAVGASIHSVPEAKEAQELGAYYLIAGHIFPTDCKKGAAPRGLQFLKDVCDSVKVPVFAIGGITKDKVKDVYGAGAKGICVMSEAMTCTNPEIFVSSFKL